MLGVKSKALDYLKDFPQHTVIKQMRSVRFLDSRVHSRAHRSHGSFFACGLIPREMADVLRVGLLVRIAGRRFLAGDFRFGDLSRSDQFFV